MVHKALLSSVLIVVLFFLNASHSFNVDVVGRTIVVDSKVFQVRAIGYSPTPPGADATITPPYGDYFTQNYSDIYLKDIPVLKSLGANVLRLWGWNNSANHTHFLDAVHAQGLWVIPTFYMGVGTYPNLADPKVAQQVVDDFHTFMYSIDEHPAVLLYELGEDLNADWNYGPERDILYPLLNKLAAIGEGILPINESRPFSTALNDQHAIPDIVQYESVSQNINIWSINVYRGCEFGYLFANFSTASKKPLLISETGIDAYNDAALALDETMQANCLTSLWNQIASNSSVAVGGTFTEFIDEWWKGKLGQNDARHPGCPNYDPAVHSNCGYPNEGFPDLYANQGWFGLLDYQLNPRKAYFAIQSLWKSA